TPQDNRLAEFERGLGRGLAGEGMNESQARALANATGEAAWAVLRAAREVRQRAKGRIVSFSKKIFIPLTNPCPGSCRYWPFHPADEPVPGLLRLLHFPP